MRDDGRGPGFRQRGFAAFVVCDAGAIDPLDPGAAGVGDEETVVVAEAGLFVPAAAALAVAGDKIADDIFRFAGGSGALEPEPDAEPELAVEVEWYEDDLTGYNTIAEIPGTDKADEIVMLGAHLDSWHAGTGATDNGAGVVVMMEAVRILKALGATRQDILLQFLIEALALCMIGGLVGVAIGFGLGALVATFLPGFPPAYVPLWAVALSFGFCAAVGVIFGIIPAAKAAQLDPIDALRYE